MPEVNQPLSKNNYIKKEGDEYNIDLANPKIVALNNNNITIDSNNISLSESTSNYYLHKLSIGNCSEQWQDWFCIPNFHNNNKYSMYPNTNNMDIGVCFKYCDSQDTNAKAVEAKDDSVYIPNNTKCTLYEDENDLIYNPLAIIAIIGTHFNIEGPSPREYFQNNYHTFSETLGLRGSYLNDLWRVNRNGRAMVDEDIDKMPLTTETYNEIDNLASTTNQDKLLIKIIYKYRTTGTNNNSIKFINKDINNAYYRLLGKNDNGKRYYIQNKEFKNNFLKKIKNYVFDIEALDKIYGKDKNGDKKLINIIAYAYNIMRLVCFNRGDTPAVSPALINNKNIIKGNIEKIIEYKGIRLEEKSKKEEHDFITQMFKYACFNCFNTNFSKFEQYIKDKIGTDYEIENFPCINIFKPYYKDPSNKYLSKYLGYDKSFIKLDKLDLSNDNTIVVKSIYDYYDNIEEYNHSVMYEYAENTANIKQILIVFSIFIALVCGISILYGFIDLMKVVHYIIYLVNYCHLFYEWLSLSVLAFFCQYYCFLFCKNSNSYSFTSIIANILNILLIIFAFGMLYYAVMELLNIDYISLLQKIDINLFPTLYSETDKSESDTFKYMIMYILIIYILSIFFYSIYIVRYSLKSNEYDIIGNKDADYKISNQYVDYILLKTYIEGLLLKYTKTYPELFASDTGTFTDDKGVASAADVTADAGGAVGDVNAADAGGAVGDVNAAGAVNAAAGAVNAAADAVNAAGVFAALDDDFSKRLANLNIQTQRTDATNDLLERLKILQQQSPPTDVNGLNLDVRSNTKLSS